MIMGVFEEAVRAGNEAPLTVENIGIRSSYAARLAEKESRDRFNRYSRLAMSKAGDSGRLRFVLHVVTALTSWRPCYTELLQEPLGANF